MVVLFFINAFAMPDHLDLVPDQLLAIPLRKNAFDPLNNLFPLFSIVCIKLDLCFSETFKSWDMHSAIYDGNTLPARAGIMDKAVGNLILDLSASGLLDETLIVLTTEFGRSPEINYNAGRDHHPAAFSAMLAGAGIDTGQFYGTSDKAGHSVDQDGVSPADLNATIAKAMGLAINEETISPTGRPFKVANDGTPIAKLLA